MPFNHQGGDPLLSKCKIVQLFCRAAHTVARLQAAWDRLKEGKVKKMVDDYMEKYRSHIYTSKEDEMEDITAEDVQEKYER